MMQICKGKLFRLRLFLSSSFHFCNFVLFVLIKKLRNVRHQSSIIYKKDIGLLDFFIDWKTGESVTSRSDQPLLHLSQQEYNK